MIKFIKKKPFTFKFKNFKKNRKNGQIYLTKAHGGGVFYKYRIKIWG